MQICTTSKKNKSPPVPIQSHQLNFIKIYGFGGGPGDPPVKEKSEPMHVPWYVLWTLWEAVEGECINPELRRRRWPVCPIGWYWLRQTHVIP